jgi:hypothetical protein
MMQLDENDTTEDQEKILNEVGDRLRQAHGEARSTLSDAGLLGMGDCEENPFACLHPGCRCENFSPSPHTGGQCSTSGCGHAFFQHCLPI